MEAMTDLTKDLIVGELYHIIWAIEVMGTKRVVSENLIQKIDNDIFPIRWLAKLGATAPDIDRATIGMNWKLIAEIKPVPKKNLPLYVSWTTGKLFERVLKGGS
jgi:hypothetical protein